MKSFKQFSIICAALLALGAGSASGEIYRWVDENGVTHFSQEKPVDSDAKSVDVPPTPPDHVIEEAQQRTTRLIETQKSEEEVSAIHQKECDLLRSQRTQLRLPGPFSMPVENGGVLVATGNKKLELLEYVENTLKEKKCN